MNERIRELGDQAWDYALDHETVNGKAASGSFINKNFSDLLLEKLAELIVRECLEQVWYTREDGINGNVSEVIKERMKQHFGVEE